MYGTSLVSLNNKLIWCHVNALALLLRPAAMWQRTGRSTHWIELALDQGVASTTVGHFPPSSPSPRDFLSSSAKLHPSKTSWIGKLIMGWSWMLAPKVSFVFELFCLNCLVVKRFENWQLNSLWIWSSDSMPCVSGYDKGKGLRKTRKGLKW